MSAPEPSNAVARPLGQIIRANVVTPYNALLTTLTILVAFTHRWADMSVGAFVLLNSGIGITQEVRARTVLARLSVLHASKVSVERNSGSETIAVESLVVDDVMHDPADAGVHFDGREMALGRQRA